MVHSGRTSLYAALLLALLALPAVAQAPAAGQTESSAAPAGSSSSVTENTLGSRYILDHPRVLARFLGLDSEATSTLLALTTTRTQTVTPLRAARAPLCVQLAADLAAASPDDAAIGADSLSLHQNKLQIKAAFEAFNTAFTAILNPTQLQSYNTLKQLLHDGDDTYSPIGRCPIPAS